MIPAPDPVDPRLYGHAPVTREVHHGDVYLTFAGLQRYVAMSEHAIRRTPALMALRRVLSPRKSLWVKKEVDAYVLALPKAGTYRLKINPRLNQRPSRKAPTVERVAALSALMAERMKSYTTEA